MLPLIVCVLLYLTSVATAADETMLEEVVVTATRYEEKVAEIPAGVTVIDEKAIATSTASTVPEVLQRLAGIHVFDIGGNGRNYSVDPGNFGETALLNTLVLVDGRKVNEPDLSGVDWSQIPLERVARIEVIRGGRGSVLYGDNATGGVINIITRGGGGMSVGGELAIGSYDTFRGSVHAEASPGSRLSSFLSASYYTSDGYRENSESEAKDFGGNATCTFGDSVNLTLGLGYHKDSTGLPGALKESDFAAGMSRRDTTHPDDFADTEDYYLQLSPEIFLGEDSVRIDSSFRKRSFLSFASGDWGSFTGDSDLATVSVSPRIVVKRSFRALTNDLILGFDYQKTDEDIHNDSLFFGERSIGNFDLSKENYGVYLHDEAGFGQWVKLSAGYRHDEAEFSFDPGTPSDISMDEDLYTTGLVLLASKNASLFLNVSKSFRYPALDELYSFFTNTANPKLQAQTSENYEIGVRCLFTDTGSVSVSAFRLDTDNELFFNPVTYTNENLDGETRRKGITAAVALNLLKILSLRSSYTYVDAAIRGGGFDGKEVPNVPPHLFTAAVDAQLKENLSVTLDGVYVGERRFISDFANAMGEQESYFVMNLKMEYRWKKLKAFFTVRNLTDKKYSEYASVSSYPAERGFYPSPERNFLAGLKAEF